MKKIIGILIILCVAITFLGIASAAEVTISDVKFNVPDDYKESGGDKQSLGEGLESEYKVFIKGDKNITIDVMTLSGNTKDVTLPVDDGVDKTIKDKNGTFSASKHVFQYKEGNKVIMIQDSNDKFEDIIV